MPAAKVVPTVAVVRFVVDPPARASVAVVTFTALPPRPWKVWVPVKTSSKVEEIVSPSAKLGDGALDVWISTPTKL